MPWAPPRRREAREGDVADKTFIQSIFIDPPIAVARLGGSAAPQDAYEWAQSQNPRTEGETIVVPAWSLNLLPDGSVEPVKPTEVKLRDGDQIRPVCPFFEVWAMVSALAGDPPGAWEERPLTLGLLQANGVTETAVRLRIDAKNRKAARRADDSALVFGTLGIALSAGAAAAINCLVEQKVHRLGRAAHDSAGSIHPARPRADHAPEGPAGRADRLERGGRPGGRHPLPVHARPG